MCITITLRITEALTSATERWTDRRFIYGMIDSNTAYSKQTQRPTTNAFTSMNDQRMNHGHGYGLKLVNTISNSIYDNRNSCTEIQAVCQFC